MTQKQDETYVEYQVDGETAAATASGGFAAWPCQCDRPSPLLGFTDVRDGHAESSLVECEECGRRYLAISKEGQRGPVDYIQEMESA